MGEILVKILVVGLEEWQLVPHQLEDWSVSLGQTYAERRSAWHDVEEWRRTLELHHYGRLGTEAFHVVLAAEVDSALFGQKVGRVLRTDNLLYVQFGCGHQCR